MLSRCQLVLVGTANPENLGGVARLCANFAVPRLTLVAPRAQPNDHRALVVGRAALPWLENARVTRTLDEAVADASYVVGFSARRGQDRPLVNLAAVAERLGEAPLAAGTIALVFGPEDTGLVKDDIARCDVIAAIDMPGALTSLNLTQAVAIALWELGRVAAPSTGQGTVARRAELDELVEQAALTLDAVGHGDSAQRDRYKVELRRVLAAAALTPSSVRWLSGLCRQLQRVVEPQGRSGSR